MKFFALALAAFVFATAATAAPFSDVPRTHWAYDAIQKAVDAGILQGYDGKFEGQRLLNRYQMAVVVAKLLDGMKSAPAGAMGSSEDARKMVGNLEALSIEFADELALLNVKVATLEDSFQELKQQVATGSPARGAAPAADGLGFTAFASFGLFGLDDYQGGGFPRTRLMAAPDSTLFDIPQVSLGVDKEVNPGVYFHAQFDFDASVNGIGLTNYGASVAVNEVYFFVDELFGDIGGKVGAFALPFSMEHNGPFRTCNYTITPSLGNTLSESVRGYGFELQKTKDVQPGDLTWKFGVMSGTDRAGWSDNAVIGPFGFFSDFPTAVNTFFTGSEGDDGFGYYVMLAKKPTEKNAFGWNIGYFDNGGDYSTTTLTPSDETSVIHLGLEWSNDDMLVMAQYMDGTSDAGPGFEIDLATWYLLVNFKVDEKQSFTLRYDDWTFDGDTLGDIDGGNGICFAYNRKVTENSMFQFEYLTVDVDTPTGVTDTNDDLWQVRYKVHF